jgi:glycosyltransferase involved in cell wall biosynthesis
MRVLQVNKYYSPVIGGVEQVIQDVAEGLSRLHGVDTEVLVCSENAPWGRDAVRGVPVFRARSFRKALGMPLAPGFFAAYRRLIRDCDVIGFHMPFPLSAIAYSLMGSDRAKVVVHYHCDIVRQKHLGLVYNPFLNRLLGGADAICASSPNLVTGSPVLQRFSGKCIPLPYAINERVARRPSSEEVSALRERLGIAPDRKVVLHVGRLVYYKGLEPLLDAMPAVDATLVVVGDGPLAEPLRRQAEALGLSSRVIFCGAVSDDDLPVHYEIGDVFVLASTAVAEAYAIVQMEAMAHGLPVINTDLPTSVPWVSQHGQTGLTVPPNDAKAIAAAINQILGSPELAKRFTEAAFVRANDFAYARVTGQVHEIYRSVL